MFGNCYWNVCRKCLRTATGMSTACKCLRTATGMSTANVWKLLLECSLQMFENCFWNVCCKCLRTATGMFVANVWELLLECLLQMFGNCYCYEIFAANVLELILQECLLQMFENCYGNVCCKCLRTASGMFVANVWELLLECLLQMFENCYWNVCCKCLGTATAMKYLCPVWTIALAPQYQERHAGEECCNVTGNITCVGKISSE